MTKEKALAALDRRAAVAAIAGASLGDLPLLWLLREALDVYGDCVQRGVVGRVGRVPLLESGDRTFALTSTNGSRILLESARFSTERERSHEAPNAALVLHDAVKDDPVKAERLLMAIESATQEGLR